MGEVNSNGDHIGTKVRITVTKRAGDQESDMMEQLTKGVAEPDALTDAVKLVSLGCFCGPKLSFQKMGRGAETLPFDWVRTRITGVLHFMRNDFDGFFDFLTRAPVPGLPDMTMYRSYHHSFWHDDPTSPDMHDRYNRRIKRFREIDARSSGVLFVRSAATSEDIHHASELLQELKVRFGQQACLLLILDFQRLAQGAAIVQEEPNLLVYFLDDRVHTGSDYAPYSEQIKTALDWMVNRPIDGMRFETVADVATCVEEMSSGLMGLGGLYSFEASPPRMESCAGTLLAGTREGSVNLVSLGCSGQLLEALAAAGHPLRDIPLHGCKLPERESVAGFFSAGFDSSRSERDDALKMARRECGRDLADNSFPFIFVRAASAADGAGEVLQAGDLVGAMARTFGDRGVLLFVVYSPAGTAGPIIVEGYDDLLVYVLCSADRDRVPPHKQLVQFALGWLAGESLEAGSVADLLELCALVGYPE